MSPYQCKGGFLILILTYIFVCTLYTDNSHLWYCNFFYTINFILGILKLISNTFYIFEFIFIVFKHIFLLCPMLGFMVVELLGFPLHRGWDWYLSSSADITLDLIKHLIDPHQYGSLPGCLTTQALVELLHSWLAALEKPDRVVWILFLDFGKPSMR